MEEFIEADYAKLIYSYWESAVYAVLVPMGLFAGKFMFNGYFKAQSSTFDINDQLVEKDNKATAVAFAGFEAGLGLVFWGAIADQDPNDSAKHLGGGIAWSLIGIVFYLVSMIMNDKVMLRGMNTVAEVEKGNMAAALTVAGNYIAAGLVCLYTVGGGGDNWGNNFGFAILFYVLCQVEFFCFYYLIRWSLRRYGNINQHLENGNVAVGVMVSITRVGLSILAVNPLRATTELASFFFWFAGSFVAVVLFEMLAFWWLVKYNRVVDDVVSHQNWGVGIVHSSALVMFSTAAISFMPGQCRTTTRNQKSFGEQLTATDYTKEKVLRWPYIIFLAFIFLYLFASKYIFAIPAAVTKSRVSQRFRFVGNLSSAVRNYLRAPRRKKKQGADAEIVEFDEEETMLGREESAMSANTEEVKGAQDSGKVSISRAISFAGYLLSVGVMLRAGIGVANSPEFSAGEKLMYTFYWISMGALMQHFGYFLQRFLIWGVSSPVSEPNVAAGILDGAIYFTIAMQVGANLLGNNGVGEFDLAQDTGMTLLFFVLQLICITIAGKVFQIVTTFDDIAEVRDGNVAVATANGLFLVACGVLTSQLGQRTVEIAALAAFFFPGLVLVIANRKIVVDRLLMHSQSLDDELAKDKNWGAALVSGTISCAYAACLTTFAREVCTVPTTIAMNITNTSSV